VWRAAIVVLGTGYLDIRGRFTSMAVSLRAKHKHTQRTPTRIVHLDVPSFFITTSGNAAVVRQFYPPIMELPAHNASLSTTALLDKASQTTKSLVPNRFVPTDEFDDDCKSAAAWQSEQHPVCNKLHAVSFVDNMVAQTGSLLAGKGTWRRAWEIQDAAVRTKTAWKFLKLKYFDVNQATPLAELSEQNRVDALAMERLTSSASIITAYGSCGTSIVAEFAATELPKAVKSNPAPEKLQIWGVSVAQGLADMESLEILPALNHNDLKAGNIVLDSNQRPMLNDFNLAVLLKRHGRTGESCSSTRPCPVKIAWRSPEEFLDDKNLAASPVRVWKDKADLYALGNILYLLATGREPWRINYKFRDEMTQLKRIPNAYPPLPNDTRTTHPAIQRLLDATQACYTFDPLQRPSAKDIVHMLQQPI